MIDFLVSWTEEIIVALIIIVIFEMLIPSSSNKKYLKVIFGIFIIYVVINPLISDKNKINFNGEIAQILDNQDINKLTYTSTDIVNGTIDELYNENLIISIEDNLKYQGYEAKVEDIEIENNQIISVVINIIGEIDKTKTEDNTEKVNIINTVKIDKITISDNSNIENETQEISEEELKNDNDIKSYISVNYGIPSENIKIVRN